MHIKDHSAAMKFFRTYDSAASKGKWKEFVDEMEFDSMLQEPRTMAQEPRIGLATGSVSGDKAEFSKAWKDYNKSYRFSGPKGIKHRLSGAEFFKIWAKENMADGGSAGQLVQNTADGSRPGYQGPDKITRSQLYSTNTPLKMDYFRHGIRSDDPARLKKIDDFVKKYETEYDVKPSAKKIRTSLNVQRRVIPFYEAKYGKLPVGKAGGAAGRTMVIDEVKQILNDPKVIEGLENGKFPTIQQVEKIIKKNISIAEGRLVDVAEKLKENKKYKSLANDYLKTVGHGSIFGGRSRKRSRVLYEKQLAEMFNIPVRISTLRKNILTKLYSIVPELKGVVGVDEIGSITASMKRSSGPYAIWGQIIGKDFNVKKGQTMDKAKSFMEEKLINLPKDSPKKSTLQTKYNIKVDEFELEANKNNPAKRVKGMKLSFEHPSKAIKNKKVYNLFKPLFDNHFEKYGFSYEVAADTDTLMDINKKLDKPFFKKQIKNNYSKIIKRSGKVGALAVIGTLAGTGWSLADEAQTAGTGVVDKAKSWPIEHPWLTGAGAAGTTATTLAGSKLTKADKLKSIRQKIKSGLGKTFRTLGTKAGALPWAAWTIAENLKSGKGLAESVVDPWVGAELMFPSMFKENVSKITKNKALRKFLNLGYKIPGTAFKIGKVTSPLGLGLTTLSALRGMPEEPSYIREAKQRQKAREEDYTRGEHYASGGLTRTVAPDSEGIMSLKKK